jgi:uncharacterized protein (TIGR02145 family)
MTKVLSLLLSIFLFSISYSQTITIGNQVWMNKNLDVSSFRNGDPIPEAKTDEEWVRAGRESRPSWCYYNNVPANGDKYGKIYNWYAVSDPRGLAPKGYHIPSDVEWTVLTDYLGGTEVAGKKIKSVNGWSNNGNGNDSSGFSAIPAGSRWAMGPFPSTMGCNAAWWTCSETALTDEQPIGIKPYGAWIRALLCGDVQLYVSSECAHADNVFRETYFKEVGLGVRCIRD